MAHGQFHNFFEIEAGSNKDASLDINNVGDKRTGVLFIQTQGSVSVDYSVRNPQDDAWIVFGTYTSDTVVEVPLG